MEIREIMSLSKIYKLHYHGSFEFLGQELKNLTDKQLKYLAHCFVNDCHLYTEAKKLSMICDEIFARHHISK